MSRFFYFLKWPIFNQCSTSRLAENIRKPGVFGCFMRVHIRWSRTAATSKLKLIVIIVNGFQPLTIITQISTLNVAAVLDPPLVCMWNLGWKWIKKLYCFLFLLRSRKTISFKQSLAFNSSVTNVHILYPLKITENLQFSGAFRGYNIGTNSNSKNSTNFP